MVRTGVDEVHETGTAVELGKEDGGVGLGLGVLDPLKTRPDAAVLAAPLAEHPASVAAHPHPIGFFFFSSLNQWNWMDDRQKKFF